MKWYVTLYTKSNNQYHLVDYTIYKTLEDAKQAFSQAPKPQYKTDFYYLESVLGCLDDSAKGVFERRKQYSHSCSRAKEQRKSEDRAKKLLKTIRSLKPNASMAQLQSIMHEALVLKLFLTKEQYDIILHELERQPIVRKVLQEEKL